MMRPCLSFLLLAVAHCQLQVIGASFGRTGTTTTKSALETLGFGVTHHMRETMSWETGLWGVEVWRETERAKPLSPERIQILREFFHDNPRFHSLLDWPGSGYYRELCEVYPDAKVLLTVRDSAEAWWDSYATTVGRMVHASFWWGVWPDPGMYLLFRLNPLWWKSSALFVEVIGSVLPSGIWNKTEGMHVYTTHHNQVKEYFKDKPEKLLVFNTKQGWEPLCRFLNVSIPQTPFPAAVNDKATMQKGIIFFNCLGFLHLFILLGVVWCCYRRRKRSTQPKKTHNA